MESIAAPVPTTPFLLTWSDVAQTEEYLNDFDLLLGLMVRSYAMDDTIDETDPFVQILAHIAAIRRYYIRHLPNVRDVDLSPFVSYLQAEVGINLPLTQSVPIAEFLKESKQWFSKKGSVALYTFIGNLVGSPLALRYPKDRIFRWDSRNSRYDGGYSTSGELPWSTTQLARFHGPFWSYYSYIVDVLQAQRIDYLSDVFSLLQAVHPAGEFYYPYLYFNYACQPLEVSNSAAFQVTGNFDWYCKSKFPAWDNGFTWDDPKSRWDMKNGNILTGLFSVVEAPLLVPDLRVRGIAQDTVSHNYLADPGQAFSRQVQTGDLTHITVYADNDAIVMQNVTTNVGIKEIPWSSFETLTWRELQYAAWDLQDQNPEGPWLQEIPFCKIDG